MGGLRFLSLLKDQAESRKLDRGQTESEATLRNSTRRPFFARLLVASLLFVPVVVCSVLGGGSPQNNAPPANTATANDALDDPKHPGIEACSSKASETSREDALEIAKSFRQSCHELVVCGGLAAQMSAGVVTLVLNAALGAATGSGGFVFDGKGVYRTNTSGSGTGMDITLRLPADTSFGKKGDIIAFDLLKLDSYFKGSPKLSAKGSIDTTGKTKYKIEATFGEPGPAYELLGLGAATTGSGPASVSFDAEKLQAAIGAILMTASTHVDDKQGKSLFVYDLTSKAEVTLAQFSAGTPLDMSLVGVNGTRADKGQTLAITKWEVRYLDTSGSGYLDGTIAFDVKGGPFPYGVTFEYPRRKDPDVTLLCR